MTCFAKVGAARMVRATLGIAIALALVVGGIVKAQENPAPTVVAVDNSVFGQILTDADGWTLYLFTRDEPGVSNCYDQCAVVWPPLIIDGDPVAPDGLEGALDVTIRTDGSRQVTFNGMPLYYFARDSQPGDTNGQGVGGVWFVLSPVQAQPPETAGSTVEPVTPTPTPRPAPTPMPRPGPRPY